MRKYPVSIFLPVYNLNPSRLIRNVTAVHDFAKENYDTFEIVIVDDNSGKETKAAIAKVIKLKNIRVLDYTNGPSRRENLAVSFSQAQYGIVCFMDADLSTELKYTLNLTDKIDEGYEVVEGSRYKGIASSRERYRFVISKVYNFALRILFGSKIRDHTCGFKGFRKQAIVELVKELGYDTSRKRGWFWDAEMLIRARRRRYKVTEIPVRWTSDSQSTFSLSREYKMVPYLIEFWFSFNLGQRKQGVQGGSV